jgi:serine-type D-Ala-D-Ala carboxypeptidase/endopeptidase (penicillin-binding protein 4)
MPLAARTVGRAAIGVGLAVVASCLLAGCGGSTRSHPRPQPIPALTVREAPPPPTPPPDAAALRSQLSRLFAQAGPASGAAVYDLSDNLSLFALRQGVPRPPASVEKLYTSVAVLRELGTDTTLQTRVLGNGFLGSRGVWHGDLYLVGGGDPTFGEQTFNHTWEFGYGPTAAQLADQLHRDGIHKVSGAVIGDGSLFDGRVGPPSTGYAPDVPDLGGQLSALTFDHGATSGLRPAAFAVRQLARTMRTIHIQANAAVLPGRAPAGARTLATVSSPPMSIILRLTDLPSDDLYAEMLTKQLGARFAGAGTTAGGAGMISQVIASYGLHPQIVDGSGLSRSDRTSPLQVVELLRQLYGTDTGHELDSALPVVGVDGTTQTIADKTAAQGRCIAKTGTLDDVTNLAGYCHTLSGKQLAFVLFVDGPSNYSAVQLESRMISAIARL